MSAWGYGPLENDAALDVSSRWEAWVDNSAGIGYEAAIDRFFNYWGEAVKFGGSTTNMEIMALLALHQQAGRPIPKRLLKAATDAANRELLDEELSAWDEEKRRQALLEFLASIGGKVKSPRPVKQISDPRLLFQNKEQARAELLRLARLVQRSDSLLDVMSDPAVPIPRFLRALHRLVHYHLRQADPRTMENAFRERLMMVAWFYWRSRQAAFDPTVQFLADTLAQYVSLPVPAPADLKRFGRSILTPINGPRRGNWDAHALDNEMGRDMAERWDDWFTDYPRATPDELQDRYFESWGKAVECGDTVTNWSVIAVVALYLNQNRPLPNRLLKPATDALQRELVEEELQAWTEPEERREALSRLLAAIGSGIASPGSREEWTATSVTFKSTEEAYQGLVELGKFVQPRWPYIPPFDHPHLVPAFLYPLHYWVENCIRDADWKIAAQAGRERLMMLAWYLWFTQYVLMEEKRTPEVAEEDLEKLSLRLQRC